MIDPEDTLDVQVAKQARIIDALVRRADRQHEVGTTAYSAFQSAIAFQSQVWAKTRDLERASSELQALRFVRERTQKNLTDAISVMDGGFALFTEGRLQVCNDLFRSLLPDISDRVLPGLRIADYFELMAGSGALSEPDGKTRANIAEARLEPVEGGLRSFVVELTEDRWFQISVQQTSVDNIVVLQTEITQIVRKNRSEKNQLIDMQGHYLQAAFDNISLGVCTFSPTGTVMIHNDRFRELLGLPYTLVQKGARFGAILDFIRANYLLSAADLDGLDAWMAKLRRHGHLRETLRHASGRVLDLHVNLLPDRGFLADLKDTTLETRATELLEKRVEERTSELTEANRRLRTQYEAQARVEEELRVAKEQAEAAVSSKTRFLAAASHDLLQPINAAKLLISTLSDISRGTEMADVVQRLDKSFSSMEDLLHALLDISRLESTGTGLTPTDFCLGTVMQAVADDQAPLAQKKGVRLRIVPSSAWVRSDQRYLLRSIQNLVVNAIQYTDTGGEVLVGCRRRGGRVTFEVWDTGIGISHNDRERIFEEFTRAENVPPGSGMGLGLSIVDRTCRHLGHTLGVRSKPGVGSVFSIEMDAVEERPRPPVPVLKVSTEEESELDLIALVVENDRDVLFALTRKLESWGVSVLGARSTEEARAHVADMGMAPDLVLADYQLDGQDTGDLAIDTIRRDTGLQVPAIMITADRSGTLVETGMQQDFTVITKPVQLSRLRALIDFKTRKAPPPAVARAPTDKSIA